MASTVTSSTLTVKVQETLTLNGFDYGSIASKTITGINEVLKRVVTCVASQTTTIATFATNTYDSAQAHDVNDAKYIRVTNLDTANNVELAIVGAATLYQVTLEPGMSHILGAADDLMLSEADTSPSFGTMADIASIQVNPGGNAVDVELFIASA